MPKFSPRRFEQILAQMIATVVARSNLSEISDASGVKNVLAAAAREDDQIYYQMGLLLDLFSIDTATDDDLDARAAEIQPGTITRFAAVKATGSVIFSRAGTTGSVTIPIGTRIKTASGLLFDTTATGTITPISPEQISGNGVGRDSNSVSAIAIAPGLAGNVAANTIVKFDSKPAGVDEVTNPSVFANGTDKESDDAFRQRIKDFIAGLARCTVNGIEVNLLGQQDPISSATILYTKVVEDALNPGVITVYVDDGTGTAESTDASDTDIGSGATVLWNGTTTVALNPTAGVASGDWIRDLQTGNYFEVDVVTLDTNVTILNPGTDVIPATGATLFKSNDVITEGLGPGDAAVGGELTLFTDSKPLKSAPAIQLASSTRGFLTSGVEYTLYRPTGQLDFSPALAVGEVIAGGYTNYDGLIQFAQKIVDGDPDDRTNFPGLRAAGIQATVLTPTVQTQTIVISVVVADGYDDDDVRALVLQAIKDYINTLAISGDVIRNKLISLLMAISGVNDVNVTTPAANVVMLDTELARTQDPNITVT